MADVRGTLKPCGCSPDLQRGGVDRVAHYAKHVRKTEPNLPMFHAGDLLVDDEGAPKQLRAQIKRKAQTLGLAFREMGLTAATLGENDVATDPALLATMLAQMPMPIVVSNAAGSWAGHVKPSFITRVGGIRIG
ncbi:MAG: 2',3'-cyclic-nucleotide 2'-phosphodiesterase (5'-nucleotidase family), partial [Myxococcota bacterium]